MELGIIGTSIWQQNMPLLERLTLDRNDKPQELHRLKEQLGLDELVYLATCNRVEFIYAVSATEIDSRVVRRLIDFFMDGCPRIGFFPNDFYHFTGDETITHLFRTASSLESLVVGETQITGQFKQAFKEAEEAGLSGPILQDLGREALQVARKVRRETALGEGALSMATLAASELTQHLYWGEPPTIAMVGAGPMTAKMAGKLKGVRYVFVNRTLEKAENLAREFGGTAIQLSEFQLSPCEVDAIVSSTAAAGPVFNSEFLDKLTRWNRRVICVDLAIPRDFSLDFMDAVQVILIDMASLKAKAQRNPTYDFVEIGKANDIVREAVIQYLSRRVEASLRPIMQESYQESLELARRALDDLFASRVTSLGRKEQDSVYRLVSKLIGHMAFQPAKMLSKRLAEVRSNLNLSEDDNVRREAV